MSTRSTERASRIYLDTNVVLDLLEPSRGFLVEARAIFDLAIAGEIELLVSALSFANIAYVYRTRPPQVVRQVLRQTIPLVPLVDLSAGDLKSAVAEDSPFRDLEDDMQHAGAVRIGAEVIITRDPTDFKSATLPVLSPADFLAQQAAGD